MSNSTSKVFVYGTLMRGQWNDCLLKSGKYISNATTTGTYRMYRVCTFPGIVKDDSDSGYRINGELYEVDAETLKWLDRLESEGSLYSRETVTVEDSEGKEHTAHIYVYLRSVEGCHEMGSSWDDPFIVQVFGDKDDVHTTVYSVEEVQELVQREVKRGNITPYLHEDKCCYKSSHPDRILHINYRDSSGNIVVGSSRDYDYGQGGG